MASTRFLVKSYGKERQIFSVRETSDGSLIVAFQTEAGNFEDGKLNSIKDYHITAHSHQQHNDRKCFGNRIKYSILTDNGDYYWHSIVVKKRKNRGFIWPLSNIFSSLPFGENFEFRVRNGDKKVEVVGYLGSGETLIYSIFVADLNENIPSVQGFGKVERSFSKLKIVLYFGFFHMVSGSFSLSREIKGALRKGKGVDPLNGAQDPSAFDPFSNNERFIENYLYENHSLLAQSFLIVYAKSYGEIVPKQLKHEWETASFSRWPALDDKNHASYGEGSRHRNDCYVASHFPNGIKKPEGWVEPLGVIRTYGENIDFSDDQE